ncbi:MAG TPA: FtsX-like permease family protein [Baekduia sp.]|nr:FtsX-like permease family protein [Baekduia sp.]
MLKVAIRGVISRKLRLILTTTAVALGVMLMAGSYIFTDTFSKGFDQLFANAFKGTDVSISAQTPFDLDQIQQPPTLSLADVNKVKAIDGVAAAEGGIFDQTATILDKKGKAITTGGAPQSIASTSSVAALDSFEFPEGRVPTGPGEIAMDQSTVERKDFKLGDTVRVQGSGALQSFKLVGELTLGGSGSVGGASIALVTLPEAQKLTGKEGKVDSIAVAADPGVTPEALRDRIAQDLGSKYDVKTGQQEQEDSAADIREGLGILRTALTAFAGIALFVGAFLIFNTFSITVAQRMRELALLRTLGASRRQVRRSVLTEGLIIGIAGSLLGLGLGALIAIGLRSLMASFGIELPGSGLVLESRTVILSLGIGVAITLISAYLPAARATRIPPIAALQEGVVLPKGRGSRLQVPIAAVIFLVGAVLVLLGVVSIDDTDSALGVRALGALICFLGIGLLSPKLVVPMARTIGAPLERMAGLTGRLARENTMRQPGRTAITASALMIGVALVTFALIFTSSFKSTLAEAVEQNLHGGAIVQDTGGQFMSFPDKAIGEIATDPNVTTVSGVSAGQGLVLGKTDPSDVSGVDPDRFAKLYELEIRDGPKDAISRLGVDGVILDADYATELNLRVGSTLAMLTPSGKRIALNVIGTKHDTTDLTGNVVVSNEVMRRDFGVDRDIFAMIAFRDGVDSDQATKTLADRLDGVYPRLKVQTDAQFQADQEKQIDQFLGIIFALLALSIIVAIFGIVNTLVLAITERTRELGLLRAIGTSRRQVRRMVRYESVITALIGTALGTIVGILFGIVVARPVEDLTFSIPGGNIVIVLILGAIVGVFAAIWPARRASKLDVLASLSYE